MALSTQSLSVPSIQEKMLEFSNRMVVGGPRQFYFILNQREGALT